MVGSKNIISFGIFELDPQAGELRRNGVKLRLQNQPFQVLEALLEHSGEAVTREELRSKVWPADTFVDFDQSLATAINKVREALGDSASNPRFIETVPRVGYRFLAPVTRPVETEPPLPGAAAVAPGPAPASPTLRRRIWTILASLLLVGGAILVFWTLRERHRAAAAPPIESIAVLPLENLSGDPAQEYFADGITEELITDIAKLGLPRVISRTSVMQYKGVKKPLPEIARELNVDAVVEGAVVRSGNRVRVTAQLVYAPADRQLWAETYERDVSDLLTLQDDVARDIARQVGARLGSVDAARRTVALVNPEAHDAYLKGRYEWNKREPASLQKSLDFFRQATALDSSYGLAYAGMADAYAVLGLAGYDALPEAEAMEKARQAALQAIQIDNTLGEAHTSLAFIMYTYDWNWEGAEKEFRRAIALNPSDATAHQWLSELLSYRGRWTEAIAEAKTALSLDPLSLIINENMARPYYYSRRFDEAVEYSRKTLQLDPSFPISHLRLGRAYAATNEYADAAREFERYRTLTGGSTLAVASIANVYGRSGKRAEALGLIAGLRKNGEHVPAYQLAIAYAGLGDRDQVMHWLEKAYVERSDYLASLNVAPLFDPMRSDPRFQDLLHRIGFAAAPAPRTTSALR